MTDIPLEDSDYLAAQTEWLRALATRLVGDADVAEDVVQETFLVALRRPALLMGGDGALRAWLHGVARNVARATRRSQSRRSQREMAYGLERPSAEPASDEVVERAASARRLIDAVLALDEPYRTAVLLAYEERLDSGEIAERTGVSPAAARKRISRGLQQLRARLGAGRNGSGHAWLLGFAGLPVSTVGPLSPLTLGATMTTKWALALASLVVLASLGFWSRNGASPEPVKPASLALSPTQTEPASDPMLAMVESSASREASLPTVESETTNPAISGVIMGRVLLTDDRTPVAGANIRANAAPVQDASAEVRGELLATTDVDGRFEISLDHTAGKYVLTAGLWVQHDDIFDIHVDPAEVSIAEGHVVEIRTVPLGQVLVRVIDSQGQPATGVDIDYALEATLGSEAQLWSYQGGRRAGTSNQQGEVVVTGIPIGMEVRFGVRGDWDKPAKVVLEMATRRAEVELHLRGWANLRAKLIWPDGSPAAGVTGLWHGTPGRRGSFGGLRSTSNAQGELLVADLSTGGGMLLLEGTGHHDPVRARVERGQTTDLGTLVVEMPVEVAGRVVLQEGSTAPQDLAVTAFRGGVPVAQLLLNGSLEFSLQVPKGTLLLALTRRLQWDPILPFQGKFLGQVNVQAPSSDVRLTLAYSSAKLTGRIAGVQAGLQVYLYDPNPSVDRGKAYPLRDGRLIAEVDQDRFECLAPPKGATRVLLFDTHGNTAYTQPIPILADQVNDLGDLQWSKGALTVQVSDSAGTALADVQVTATNFQGEDFKARTGENGMASFELGVGPYGLRAETSSETTGAWQLVQIESGRTAKFELGVAGVGILRGSVHSPLGPVAGVSISCQREQPYSNLGLSATTDATGQFAFQDMLPGIYRYWISGELVGHVELRSGEPVLLDLEVRTAKSTLEVMQGGEPLTWARSLVVAQAGAGRLLWTRGKSTGSGRFEVALPRGPLRFSIDLGGLGNNQGLFVPAPAATGSSYRLDLPSTGIELRLKGAAAHAPIPSAYMLELEGEPALTQWGKDPEMYAEDLGLGADGVRTVRFPFLAAGALVRIDGLGPDGTRQTLQVRVEAGGWTLARWL